MAEPSRPGQSNGDYGDAADALKPGTVLRETYEIYGVLYETRFGTVYQARDLRLQRLFAVKELRYASSDPNLRKSALMIFRREANILATLNHPAIPNVYDCFDLDDRAYLVMEYINGTDLEMHLSITRELPVEKVLEWAIDLCDVLHYLHSYQPEPIIHRDVIPANVMIDSLGKVHLIDFSIAKNFVSGVKHTMVVTEGYSPPEQYKGDVTPLSDIYSLGATLRHVLTRQDPRLEPPFTFDERPIKNYNPNVPDELAAIVEKALAFDPKDRWQSAAEMKAALERLRWK